MAVHNGQEWLPRALESLATQQYESWELLAVDDGSTDDSFKLLRSAAVDPRIRSWRWGTASGSPAAPRSFGLSQARGDYICLLDQDDEWAADKLAAQHDKFQQGGWAVVYSDAFVSSPDGEQQLYSDLWGPLVEGDVGEDLVQRCFVPALSAAFTRKTAREAGAFRASVRGMDDYDYWLRIAASGGRFGLVDRPLATWHVHGANLSAQPRNEAHDLRRLLSPFRNDAMLGPAVRRRLAVLRRLELEHHLRDYRAGLGRGALIRALRTSRTRDDLRCVARAWKSSLP